MSRKVATAPLALTSNGDVLVNLAEFDGPGDLQSLLVRALRQRGRVFIGVELTRAEVSEILENARHAHADTVAHIAGRRQRRR